MQSHPKVSKQQGVATWVPLLGGQWCAEGSRMKRSRQELISSPIAKETEAQTNYPSSLAVHRLRSLQT